MQTLSDCSSDAYHFKMSQAPTLLTALGGDAAEQSEFEQLLIQHFGSASHPVDREVWIGRGGNSPALKLIYNRDGLLVQAQPFEGLCDAEVADIRSKVRAHLLASGPPKVRRRVLFSAVPTVGWFRYRDVFQLLPVPPEAPRPGFMLADHPLYLEFKFASSSEFMISQQRQERIGRELELVCSALLAFRVWSIGPQIRHHWTIEPDDDVANASSKFLQETYMWPGMSPEGDCFTETSSLPPLSAVEPHEYYARLGIYPDQVLDIPSDFTDLFDIFAALPKREREQFLRAAYWFQHATDVFAISQSAAFIALVSAVEALSSSQSNGERCPACGKGIGPGPTKQFADFVEAHLTNSSIAEADRKRFYNQRSALSHGGRLLHNDRSLWGFTPKTLAEGSEIRALWAIVHTVLRNWLAHQTTASAPLPPA